MRVIVPAWLSNVLLFVTIYLSGSQHLRLNKENPVTTVQFFMIIFCLIMIVVIDFYGQLNPWLSVFFFAVALGSLLFMLRQRRYMPSRNRS